MGDLRSEADTIDEQAQRVKEDLQKKRQLVSPKPFTKLGVKLDRALGPEHRGWLLFSLALALLLYLLAWFIDDTWRFLLRRVAFTLATPTPITTPLPATLTPPSTPTLVPIPLPTSLPPPLEGYLSSLSLPSIWLGGMACGAFLVVIAILAVYLVYYRAQRS
jgi:hypothetical protein